MYLHFNLDKIKLIRRHPQIIIPIIIFIVLLIIFITQPENFEIMKEAFNNITNVEPTPTATPKPTPTPTVIPTIVDIHGVNPPGFIVVE